MISVPVQVGVELGATVAVRVGRGVSEAVAVTGGCASLWEGNWEIEDGIMQAVITSNPRTPRAIPGFRLRSGFVIAGVELAFSFSIEIGSFLISFTCKIPDVCRLVFAWKNQGEMPVTGKM
jgi:hypothetical protein